MIEIFVLLYLSHPPMVFYLCVCIPVSLCFQISFYEDVSQIGLGSNLMTSFLQSPLSRPLLQMWSHYEVLRVSASTCEFGEGAPTVQSILGRMIIWYFPSPWLFTYFFIVPHDSVSLDSGVWGSSY